VAKISACNGQQETADDEMYTLELERETASNGQGKERRRLGKSQMNTRLFAKKTDSIIINTKKDTLKTKLRL